VTKNRKLTAAEFAAELEKDPAYQAKLAKQRERASQIEATERLVLNELAAVGFSVDSLADLRLHHLPLPPEIVSVLLTWLPRLEEPAVQEAIARDLAQVQEPFDVTPLLELFERTASESVRWAIANTIAELRPLDSRDWVIRALERRDFGRSREMLPLALARIAPSNVANRVLRAHLDEMPGHVALGLAESGGPEELEVLRQKAQDSKGWVRKELQRAIKKIEKRVGAD
jgi:HEAT repeat protein